MVQIKADALREAGTSRLDGQSRLIEEVVLAPPGRRLRWFPLSLAHRLRGGARRTLCAALLCMAGIAGVHGAPEDGSVEPRYIREIWLDEARQRHVNVRIALPPRGVPQENSQGDSPGDSQQGSQRDSRQDSGALPVLLFSTPQGFRWGGHIDHYTALAEELLRRGVVMVTVSHYDLAESMGAHERFSDIYPGILAGARNDASVDRFEDCLFVLDALARINGEQRDGWPILDLERIAVGGHSSGTLTALHMAGLPVRDRDGQVFAVHRDARVKAFVIYGYPLEYSGPSRADLKQVAAVAGLHVAGSRDHPEYRNTSYRYIDSASQYWLVADGDHNVGAFGSEELILQVTGDFIDAYLHDDAEARAKLRKSALQAHKSALIEFRSKSPSRWPKPDQRDFVAWVREFLPWGEWLHARAIAYYRARENHEQ
jgi:hypothetical protein